MYTLNRALDPMSMNRNRSAILILFILVELLILYAFVQDKIAIVLAVVFGIGIILFTTFSVERSFYLLLFYYLSFPMKTFYYNFPNWKIFFIWYVGLPLFFWLLGNWSLHLIRNQIRTQSTIDKLTSTPRFSFQPMDKLLIIFIIAFSISAVVGFFRGFNRIYWAYDFFGLLMYSGYFIYLYSPLSKNPRRLFDFIVLISLFVSAQYIYSLTQFGSAIVLRRVASEHIHIAQLSLPYLGATILYASRKFHRVILVILFMIILFGVLICQQRSLWASIFLTMIMLLLIFAYEKRRFLLKNRTKLIIGIAAFSALVVGSYFLMQTITKSKLLPTIISRIMVFLSPKMLPYDISTITRISEIKKVFSVVENDFLFGRGLGDWVVTRWRRVVQITVDNSYAVLYWKTGWIGVITFTFVILYFFKRCISTLMKKLQVEERIYVLASFLNFVGMFIVSIINCSLAHFRMIIIWAATFGVVELIARKYESK